MRLKSKCNGCQRKLEIEGDPGVGTVSCPQCGGTVKLPQTILDQGQMIGGFKVNRHIGSGSMGDVYLATQINMERDVAIKILPPKIGEDKEAVNNFLIEVRTLAKLDHPNIVTAFEAGESDGHYYLAMTYVDGGSLEDRLEAQGPIPQDVALHICIRVAQALRYAWDRFQIIHRDIKPENIMMDMLRNEPKILDLGISRIIGDDSKLHAEKGMLIGTPHFMSPEQANAQDDLDCRSDMYSLGCTLYRMVTGVVPYEGSNPMVVLTKHLNDPITDPLDHNPDLHPDLVDLIVQLMQKDPNERYDDWTELITVMKEVLSTIKPPDEEFDTNTQPMERIRGHVPIARKTLHLDDEEDVFEEPEDFDDVPDNEEKKPLNIQLVALIVLSTLLVLGILGIMGLEIFKRVTHDDPVLVDENPVIEARPLDEDAE